MYAELHPEADREFAENALFYEGREPGLGDRFIDEIEAAIAVLLLQPGIGRQIEDEFRNLVLDEFPFSLIYRIEPQKILIIAFAHQSRRPGYWRARTGENSAF